VHILCAVLNFGSFLHLNGEEDSFFLDSKMEFILVVRDMNQGNPSTIFAMDLWLKTGTDLHFLLHAVCNRLQPFATICNQKHSGWLKIDILAVLPPFFRIYRG